MTVNGRKLCFGCTDNKTKLCSGISSSGELELGPRHWGFQEGDVVSEVEVIQHFGWISSRPSRTGYHSTVRSRCPTQKVVNKNNKKEGGQNITLKNSCCYIKGFGDASIHHYSAAGIAVKNFYDVDCNCSVDEIKGFLKIHKGNSKWELVFLETFHNTSQYVDLLCTASTWSKATLIFPQNRIYMWSNAIGPDRTFVNQERNPRSWEGLCLSIYVLCNRWSTSRAHTQHDHQTFFIGFDKDDVEKRHDWRDFVGQF